jgi:release factor glutamine methyltransferase
VTIQRALQQASALLEEAGIPAPRLTAEVFLCHVLGRERSYLYGHPEEMLDRSEYVRFGRCLYERLSGKPTQYITGRQEFYGREFLVTPDVLIPRPETELVVEAAMEFARSARRILDVGCGSGAIAVTLSLECNKEVLASDISLPALRVARRNALRLGARVELLASDLLSCFSPESLDLIVSNPPYVAFSEEAGLQREVRDHEPHVALFAGQTGLEIYQRLVAQAVAALRSGGALILELGYRSCDEVRAMLGPPWRNIQIRHDLAGIPRVLSATL